MTLSTTANKVSYAGDGATSSFSIPFLFLEDGHIEAVLRDINGAETLWALNTQFTLSGAGSASGGTLTISTGPTDYTPASGETLIIRRVAPETQETDYPEGGAFPAAAHEQALDKLTMLIQQHSEEIGRALALPVSSAFSDITVPEPGASEMIRWNAAGTALETVAIANLSLSLDTVLSALAANDFLQYDGTNWVNKTPAQILAAIGALTNLVDDTTPQLGGNLDANGKVISWNPGDTGPQIDINAGDTGISGTAMIKLRSGNGVGGGRIYSLGVSNSSFNFVVKDFSGGFDQLTVGYGTGSTGGAFVGNVAGSAKGFATMNAAGYYEAGDQFWGAKAWVVFDGTAATITPAASKNVSSITDNGIGLYTVNFTNAMSSTNYAVLVTAGDASGNASYQAARSMTTSSFQIVIHDSAVSLVDRSIVSAVVFGA